MIQYDKSGLYKISGALSFDTVPKIWDDIQKKYQAGIFFHEESSIIILDLAAVTSSDSAALSLLIELMQWFNQLQKQLLLRNIPEQMCNLAKVSGIAKWLPEEK